MSMANKSSLSVLAGLIGLGLLKGKTGGVNTASISMDLIIDVSSITDWDEIDDFKDLLSGLSRMSQYINWTYEEEDEYLGGLIAQNGTEEEEIDWILDSLFSPRIHGELKYDILDDSRIQEVSRMFSWANIEIVRHTKDIIKYKIVVDLNVLFKIWEFDLAKRNARARFSSFEDYLRQEIKVVLGYIYSIVWDHQKPPYRIENVHIPMHLKTSAFLFSPEGIRRF